MTFSIIVPFRGDNGHRDRVWKWCERFWASRFTDEDHGYELIVADSCDVPFSRGNSRNEGAAQAKGDVLFFADADGVNENCHEALKMVHHNGGWVVAYPAPRGYIALNRWGTERLLATDPSERLAEPQSADWYERCHSYAGAIACRTEDFWLAGGYDPRFEGWGYEDDAFTEAMSTIVGPPQRTGGFHLHLWHPHVESERFRQPHISENKALAESYTAARGNREAMLKIVRER